MTVETSPYTGYQSLYPGLGYDVNLTLPTPPVSVTMSKWQTNQSSSVGASLMACGLFGVGVGGTIGGCVGGIPGMIYGVIAGGGAGACAGITKEACCSSPRP